MGEREGANEIFSIHMKLMAMYQVHNTFCDSSRITVLYFLELKGYFLKSSLLFQLSKMAFKLSEKTLRDIDYDTSYE